MHPSIRVFLAVRSKRAGGTPLGDLTPRRRCPTTWPGARAGERVKVSNRTQYSAAQYTNLSETLVRKVSQHPEVIDKHTSI